MRWPACAYLLHFGYFTCFLLFPHDFLQLVVWHLRIGRFYFLLSPVSCVMNYDDYDYDGVGSVSEFALGYY